MRALGWVLVVVALLVWVLVPAEWGGWVTCVLLWSAAFVLKHAFRNRVRTASLSEVADLLDAEQRRVPR